MAVIKETSVDTIIYMIQMKREEEKRIKGDLRQVQNELGGLYDQAKSALQGTGLELVVADALAETSAAEPKLTILEIPQLKEWDKILVKVCGESDWEEATVDVPGAFSERGFSVKEILSDGSTWVDPFNDRWHFVSRP